MWAYVFKTLGYIPRSVIAGSYPDSLRNGQTIPGHFTPPTAPKWVLLKDTSDFHVGRSNGQLLVLLIYNLSI